MRRYRAPTHPGVLMRQILNEDFGLAITAAARRMGISRQSLHAVMAGRKAVTADMALRFSRLVRTRPEIYLYMQAKRDIWIARRRHDA